MARRVVEIRLGPTPPADGGWQVESVDPVTGEVTVHRYADHVRPRPPLTWAQRLPAAAEHLAPRLEALQTLIDANLDWDESFDAVDLAALWAHQADRHTYLAQLESLAADLVASLGTAWDVRISREPAVSDVRMFGEYGCTWPLWRSGASDREDWPMLSDALAARLTAWAIAADPDSGRRNGRDATDQLVADLRRELGPTFDLTPPDPRDM